MHETYAIRVYKQYFNFGSAHFLIFEDGYHDACPAQQRMRIS